jgi:hypothetical protein
VRLAAVRESYSDNSMRVVAVMLAALAFAPAQAGAAQAPSSGLRGTVTRGPIAPVCFASDDCTAPAAGVVLQFWRSGQLVARARTGPAGGYVIRLRAGLYSVKSAQAPAIGAGLRPRQVRVPRDRVARVNFFIDTGIQ